METAKDYSAMYEEVDDLLRGTYATLLLLGTHYEEGAQPMITRQIILDLLWHLNNSIETVAGLNLRMMDEYYAVTKAPSLRETGDGIAVS